MKPDRPQITQWIIFLKRRVISKKKSKTLKRTLFVRPSHFVSIWFQFRLPSANDYRTIKYTKTTEVNLSASVYRPRHDFSLRIGEKSSLNSQYSQPVHIIQFLIFDFWGVIRVQQFCRLMHNVSTCNLWKVSPSWIRNQLCDQKW